MIYIPTAKKYETVKTGMTPFVPAIIPLVAISLIYIVMLGTLPTSEAKYEGGTGQNAAHTNCLRANARSHTTMYRAAVADYKSDVRAAKNAYNATAREEKDEALAAGIAATIRLGPGPALAVALAVIAAELAHDLWQAGQVRDRAFREASSDLAREERAIDRSFEAGAQACHNAHANPVGGDSYETNPNAIFNQGFNPAGIPIGGGCGVGGRRC